VPRAESGVQLVEGSARRVHVGGKPEVAEGDSYQTRSPRLRLNRNWAVRRRFYLELIRRRLVNGIQSEVDLIDTGRQSGHLHITVCQSFEAQLYSLYQG
jgi:hypothetical protein